MQELWFCFRHVWDGPFRGDREKTPWFWNGNFTEFTRLLPLNQLERFHGCLPSVTDSIDVDQEVLRAAEQCVSPVRRRVDDEPGVLHAAQEYFERCVHFQARERTAETDVDAAAPAEGLVVLAFGIEFVRVGEPLRIAVPGAVHEVNRRTLRDSRPRDLDVGESGPGGPKED